MLHIQGTVKDNDLHSAEWSNLLLQGQIQVWANPTPLPWQLNRANLAYFGAITANYTPPISTLGPLLLQILDHRQTATDLIMSCQSKVTCNLVQCEIDQWDISRAVIALVSEPSSKFNTRCQPQTLIMKEEHTSFTVSLNFPRKVKFTNCWLSPVLQAFLSWK